MKYFLYSIKDAAGEEFTPVFCSSTDQVATREFVLCCMNLPDYLIQSYDLYLLGSFDSVLGLIDNLDNKIICSGVECSKKVADFKDLQEKKEVK